MTNARTRLMISSKLVVASLKSAWVYEKLSASYMATMRTQLWNDVEDDDV
jgi:hypothetical protein